MLVGAKVARGAVLQSNAHASAQNEHPLAVGGAVKLAAETDWALPQLLAAAGHKRSQTAVRGTLVEGNELVPEARAPVFVGEEDGLDEIGHATRA